MASERPALVVNPSRPPAVLTRQNGQISHGRGRFSEKEGRVDFARPPTEHAACLKRGYETRTKPSATRRHSVAGCVPLAEVQSSSGTAANRRCPSNVS